MRAEPRWTSTNESGPHCFQCNQSVHIVQSIAGGREEPDLFDVSIKPFVSRLNFTTTQKSHIIKQPDWDLKSCDGCPLKTYLIDTRTFNQYLWTCKKSDWEDLRFNKVEIFLIIILPGSASSYQYRPLRSIMRHARQGKAGLTGHCFIFSAYPGAVTLLI